MVVSSTTYVRGYKATITRLRRPKKGFVSITLPPRHRENLSENFIANLSTLQTWTGQIFSSFNSLYSFKRYEDYFLVYVTTSFFSWLRPRAIRRIYNFLNRYHHTRTTRRRITSISWPPFNVDHNIDERLT